MGSVGVPIAAFETVWLESNRFADAERQYYEAVMNQSIKQNSAHISSSVSIMEKIEKQSMNCPLDTMKQEPQLQDIPEKHGKSQSSLASEIAFARQKIQNLIKSGDTPIDANSAPLLNRMEKLETSNNVMKQTIENLTSQMSTALYELSRIQDFIKTIKVQNPTQAVKSDTKTNLQNGSSATPDDDDLDLFGSDEETEDDVKLKEERLKAYAEKKSKKPALVAKSSVVLDVKPWDDETDMKAMETAVRKITSDGLVWGASKLVPLAYGIKKLQIVAIVEDEKVSVDWLQETIENIEDLVQSVDIAAFNKL